MNEEQKATCKPSCKPIYSISNERNIMPGYSRSLYTISPNIPI